jgi:acyl-CoA reductase-like NAD-dependent aldehyde dehydrogenase
MRRLADLVAERSEALAETETRDNGKLLAEMRGQLKGIAECWHYYAGLADKIQGDTIPVEKPDLLAFTTREPIGVVAALTAWNSPLGFVAQKCAPALAAGCAVVVKPSEFASVSTLEFAALTLEAGIPPGVFNVVTGLGQEAGAALVTHPDVAMVSFTGSDETGARIAATAGAHMKRVALELGGKSPNIVFEDADLDLAARAWSRASSALLARCAPPGRGSWCRLPSRSASSRRCLPWPRGSGWEIRWIRRRMSAPSRPPRNFDKVLRYIEVARADGARCILGGRRGAAASLGARQFVEPTIFTDVTPGMRIARGGGLRPGSRGDKLRRPKRRPCASPMTSPMAWSLASGPKACRAPCA